MLALIESDRKAQKVAAESDVLRKIGKNQRETGTRLLNQIINKNGTSEWTFKTHGIGERTAEEYLSSSQGEKFLHLLKQIDETASSKVIYNRAEDLLSTGSTLPTIKTFTQGEKLIKIVPKGQDVSPYSPFFTTESELLKARKSGKTLADSFGLPKVSENTRYTIYEVKAKKMSDVFISTVAPTTEALIHRSGGSNQYLLPNRQLWSKPQKIGEISN